MVCSLRMPFGCWSVLPSGLIALFFWHFERPWAAGEARESCLVLIGHGLDQAQLEAAIHASLEFLVSSYTDQEA